MSIPVAATVAMAGLVAVWLGGCAQKRDCGCNQKLPGGNAGGSAKEQTMVTAQKTVTVDSSAFANGQAIPKKFTGEGQNVSPALKFGTLPEGTQELALIVDDPDAPRAQPFVHWVLYNMPASIRQLPEGVDTTPQPKAVPGAAQGKNDARGFGYTGPMPPPGHGVHHYYFKLYALDKKLDLRPGLTKDEVMEAIKPHMIAAGELMGTYERK